MAIGEHIYGAAWNYPKDAILSMSLATGVFPLERRIRSASAFAALSSNIHPDVVRPFILRALRSDPHSPNMINWLVIGEINLGNDATELIDRMEPYSEDWKEIEQMRKLNEMRQREHNRGG